MNLARTARTAAISALMTIGTLATLTSMAAGMEGCAWWQKHADPVIKPIETCAGQSVNGDDFKEALTDLQTKNFADLGAMGIRLGWDVVACLVDDIGAQDANLKPAGEEFKSRNAEKIKAARAPSVSLRSPGDGVPAAPPAISWNSDGVLSVDGMAGVTFANVEQGNSLVISSTITIPPTTLTVNADWSSPHECDSGSHSITVMAPGVVCLRDGVTWDEAMQKVADMCQQSVGGCTFDGGNPLIATIFEMARPFMKPLGLHVSSAKGSHKRADAGGETFAYAGGNVGAAADKCETYCGPGEGLYVPGGCRCWRGVGINGRWVSAEDL